MTIHSPITIERLDHDTTMYCETCQVFAEVHAGEILPAVHECGQEMEEQGCQHVTFQWNSDENQRIPHECNDVAVCSVPVGQSTQGSGPVTSWITVYEFRCQEHR